MTVAAAFGVCGAAGPLTSRSPRAGGPGRGRRRRSRPCRARWAAARGRRGSVRRRALEIQRPAPGERRDGARRHRRGLL